MTTKSLLQVGLLVFASAKAAASVAAAESTALSSKVESMRVNAHAPVLEVLGALGLTEAADFAILNAQERDEMMAGMEAGGVCLGDRAKLRHHFGMLIADTSSGTSNQNDAQELRLVEAVGLQSTPSNRGRLQEAATSSGLSADTIALVVTALLGVGTFFLQVTTFRTAKDSV